MENRDKQKLNATMAKSLKAGDKKQLSKWIGGNKGLELLYQASRDGCSAQAFHKKCDNKGPTLVVLYNTANCVFGGYTSANWNTTSGYVNDPHAFLFKLYYKGNYEPKIFQTTKPAYAICCNGSYGPIFGAGHDLICFGTGPYPKSGQYYQVGAVTAFGDSFNMQGDGAATITGDNLQFTEIEVYRVTGKLLTQVHPYNRIN